MSPQPSRGATTSFTLGLVVHPTARVDECVRTIVAWAAAHSARVIGRDQDSDRLASAVDTVADTEFLAEVDGVVSLGGDGTMLSAMRQVMRRPVPVLGVNHGGLGFLVEITPATLEAALARLIDGAFIIESHSCLVAETTGPAELATRAGFNDIVLARVGRGSAVSIDLAVNGQRYGYYRCDALVLSTPNGSTAYNYAAGGPIVSPSASAIVLTPVAPSAGISRAVVLGSDDEVSLHVAEDSTRVAVDIDGTSSATLNPGSVLTAYLRQDAAQVVRLSGEAHTNRSRLKLGLLNLPLRGDQLLDLIPEELRIPERALTATGLALGRVRSDLALRGSMNHARHHGISASSWPSVRGTSPADGSRRGSGLHQVRLDV